MARQEVWDCELLLERLVDSRTKGMAGFKADPAGSFPLQVTSVFKHLDCFGGYTKGCGPEGEAHPWSDCRWEAVDLSPC